MTLHQFFQIVEMRTKIISMGTFFSALVYVFVSEGSLFFTKALIMALATLCVDMGTTGFNTFFDYYHGTDNRHYTKEEEKVLVHQDINPLYALLVSLALFGFAAALGLYLAYLTSFYLIVVGSLCMVVGFFYTAGPYPISRTPFGELFAGMFLGTTLFLITLYTQEKSIAWEQILVSLPFLLLIAMILSVNNGCDRIGDKASGRKTLAVLLGPQKASYLIAVEAYGAYALSFLLIVIGSYPLTMIPALLIIVLEFAFSYKNVIREGLDEDHKSKHMGFAAKTYFHFCLAFMLSFFISLVMS